MASQSTVHRTVSELTLQRLADDRVLAPIHQAFAELLGRLDPQATASVPLAAALVSEQLARGHVCLDLRRASEIVFSPDGEALNPIRYSSWPELQRWGRELGASPLVDTREAAQSFLSLERPLVFEAAHQRLYLARYWFYQQRLATLIAQRLQATALPFDETALTQLISTLFPRRLEPAERDQCLAAANAVDQRFAVITGGPGTGKTTTVAKLLALRVMQQTTSGPDATGLEQPLRLLLMAPTGKAAQRLNESLSRAAERLDVTSAVKEQLKSITAGTIHRVLGWTATPPEEGGPFRHHAQHPLDADVVLVDEASMVDIGLMWHLFDAVRPDAQIILMGDRDQLASVEAGGVLSDLAGSGDDATLSPRRNVIASRTGIALPEVATPANGLNRAISTLRFSHRFSAESAFGQLAAAIRAGRDDEVIDLLRKADPDRIRWLDQADGEAALTQLVDQAAVCYREYLDQLRQTPLDPLRVLSALAGTRVLCAHREGASGERALNQRLVNHFDQAGWLRPRSGDYPGRAVIVTANDYQQGLFNGDVGLAIATPQGRGLSLLFDDPSSESQWRLVPAALAPDTRDCWAMTIHKSQGSEFRNVFVVLPEFESPILSRELLYTAVTRVKDEHGGSTHKSGYLCIAARESVLRSAVRREIRRMSGIRDAINQLLPGDLRTPVAEPSPTPVRVKPVQRKFEW